MKRSSKVVVIGLLLAIVATFFNMQSRPEMRPYLPGADFGRGVTIEKSILGENKVSFVETKSWSEKVCRSVLFDGKKRNVCKDVTFSSTAPKDVRFCYTGKIKSVRKTACKNYKVKAQTNPFETVQEVSLPEAPAGSYAFSEVDGKGNPVRFEVCKSINWMVSGSEGEVALTRDAITELASATGLTFREVKYDGYRPLVDDLPNSPNGRTGIVIRWSDDSEVSELKGNVSGITSSLYWTQGTRLWRSFSAIALERLSSDLSREGGNSSWIVLLHELGHAVGLDHVEDNAQLMYPTTSALSADRYQNGDLAGLARVGVATTRCHS